MGDNCTYNTKIWDKCENKLKSDSRLTVLQTVENGEETEIWTWAESTSINQWQGKAFAPKGPIGTDIPGMNVVF
jgi:hypothetical protein